MPYNVRLRKYTINADFNKGTQKYYHQRETNFKVSLTLIRLNYLGVEPAPTSSLAYLST